VKDLKLKLELFATTVTGVQIVLLDPVQEIPPTVLVFLKHDGHVNGHEEILPNFKSDLEESLLDPDMRAEN
jgi:hypothetical protein